MTALTDLIEQLAPAVMACDANDLQALATVHSLLQLVTRQASELPAADAAAGRVGKCADNGATLIERIMLREVDDTAKSLQQVLNVVDEMQRLVRGEVWSAPENVAAPMGQAQTAPATTAVQGEAESDLIRADDAPLVAEFIGEARTHIESAEGAVLKVEEHPEDLESVNAIFRSFHTIKGVAGFLNLKQIGSVAHAAESLLDPARKGSLVLTPPAIDVILETIDFMKAMITALEQALTSNQPIAAQPGMAGLLERLDDCTKGKAIAKRPAKASGGTETTREDGEKSAAPAAGTASPGTASGGTTAETTVKISTDRLDSLIDMIGELVIAESMVRQDVILLAGDNQRLARNSSHLGKITRALQELSMSMRMVPIQGVFQKMTRLVRDLARKAGKEIDLVVTGGETELDRNVVEAIGDPLVHMIRNSVDHGIETPEARQKAGKLAAGRVELQARHQGGNIVISIGDDGKGLDKKRILKKAMDAGLVRDGQELSEPEIFALIFHPGLSTAEKITDVSGRGVGMDVVRKNIDALRGRIEITSTEGQGTRFVIKLPLTLAVIDGLVVKVGTERYILPMTSVEQSLRPAAGQISTVHGRGEVCLIRGSLLPLTRLHRLFNVTPKQEDPTKALTVIVQDNQRRGAILVDELLGQQQVVIKSLGERIGNIRGVSGGAILGDGNISLILDVPGLLESAKTN